MTIRLTDDEAWAAIEAAHTGILTTLRADGQPIALPVWFVIFDRTICLSTPAASKKVQRIRHDPRASVLVESGQEWQKLRGVHVSGRVYEVSEPARSAVRAALEHKYRAFRSSPETMPERVQRRYADFTILCLVPEGRLLTWDNSKGL